MKKTHTCMNCGASLTAGEALTHTQTVICKPSSSSSWEDKIYDLLTTSKSLGKGWKAKTTHAGTANEIIAVIHKEIQQQNQSLYELILKDVIGEDDETVSYEEYQKMSNTEQLKYGKEPLYSIHRNNLRKTQRKVLSEIFE